MSKSSSSSSSILQQLLPNVSLSKQKLLNPSSNMSTNFSSEPEETTSNSNQRHHHSNNRRSNQLNSMNTDSLNGSTNSLNINNKPARTSLHNQHQLHSKNDETTGLEPVLMTPDAFINSPNSKPHEDSFVNKSLSPGEKLKASQQSNDLMQNFVSISGAQVSNSLNNSTNKSLNSLMLSTSSRASSLTQVTAATNLINPLSNSIVAGGNQNIMTMPVIQPQSIQQQNSEIKIKIARRKDLSSSSSSSSCSSSSSSDPNDQEIALLSSVAAANNSFNKLTNEIQISSLLNKVSASIKLCFLTY